MVIIQNKNTKDPWLKTTVSKSLEDSLQPQRGIFQFPSRFLLYDISRKFAYFKNFSVTHLKSHVNKKCKNSPLGWLEGFKDYKSFSC